jgi:hypothetical protein
MPTVHDGLATRWFTLMVAGVHAEALLLTDLTHIGIRVKACT